MHRSTSSENDSDDPQQSSKVEREATATKSAETEKTGTSAAVDREVKDSQEVGRNSAYLVHQVTKFLISSCNE